MASIRRQTYGYLSSCSWYQIIAYCLVTEAEREQFAHNKLLLDSKPAISRPQIQCANH